MRASASKADTQYHDPLIAFSRISSVMIIDDVHPVLSKSLLYSPSVGLDDRYSIIVLS